MTTATVLFCVLPTFHTHMWVQIGKNFENFVMGFIQYCKEVVTGT